MRFHPSSSALILPPRRDALLVPRSLAAGERKGNTHTVVYSGGTHPSLFFFLLQDTYPS